jgi:putative membrane protein insertion efficiency factor
MPCARTVMPTPNTISSPQDGHTPSLIIALVRFLHRGYKLLLSPWIGQQCRFYPTCSDYALEAIERHGILAGLFLAIKRVGRCHPYCEGGVDPVPSPTKGSADPSQTT